MTDDKNREHKGKTVWIYEEGDVLKIFDTADDARAWFEKATRKV